VDLAPGVYLYRIASAMGKVGGGAFVVAH